MVRATATLSNCYTPLPIALPLPLSSLSSSSSSPLAPFYHRRRVGRRRRLHPPLGSERTDGGGDEDDEDDEDDDDDDDDNEDNDDDKDNDGAAADGDRRGREDGDDRHGEHRNDERCPRSLRRLHMSRSVLSHSSGSCLLELGQTKVLCSVRGPRPLASSSLSSGGDGGAGGGGQSACINVEARYAPSFGVRPETMASAWASPADAAAPTSRMMSSSSSSSSSALSGEEADLSSRLRDAVLPAILLDNGGGGGGDNKNKNFGGGINSAVDVLCVVLQSDGGMLGACIAACSVALADAGIGMLDLPVGCTVAAIRTAGDETDEKSLDGNEGGNNDLGSGKKDAKKIRNNHKREQWILLADPTESELQMADGTTTLAMLPTFREVTAWEQTGRLPPETSSTMIQMCRDGCVTMHKFVRNCLVGE